jgi:PAS domain S-box-containing protein
VTEFSGYALSPLREGPFTLHRGLGEGLASILLVAPAGDDLSPGSLQRLEHEYALRGDLDGDWAARPVEFLRREAGPMLVLADPGGEPLERLLGRPMAVTEFLRIAVPLAAAVGRLHARGLIHKDLKPANILVDTASGSAWLTGFGIASRLPREHQAPAPPEVIAGTLAYMAPEQTGRMNRSVDSRSDLYALGVTFYEMLTGGLPFTASDPMEWVHCHIARRPVHPAERVPGGPAALSAIIMKLLAKTAEERYQTAAGLERDLRRCLTQWEAQGRIDDFLLGEDDTSDRLLIAEKLYGREREVDVLLAAFDRVVASGAPELVLVSGYSGIGKSAVVHELHKALVPPRGLFASGKFDQYNRDIPYAPLAQAFQGLIRPLLGKSDAGLTPWRELLREALGPNGQLMVDLVPELRLIIGDQPPVLELPPQDAQRHFQLVFRRFIGVFARPEHPLVLFLDDLQWLDAATLDLLEHLATEPELRHLLLVGAYRDNEVTPAHPLMRRLAAIRSAGGRVQESVLAPLGLEDVERLIADALNGAAERVAPLASLVHEKTAGNPFFTIQFLIALAEEGLLAADHGQGRWSWDLERIRTKGYTDNVVDLMLGQMRRLPAATQDALQLLACLGNSAAISTLAVIRGGGEAALEAVLWEAARAGLVLRLEGSYRFLHDRVQEAAYALIPEGKRPALHLATGRLLAAQTSPEAIAENVFEIVGQLNRGSALITSSAQRDQVAELNLIAGQRAKAATAYAAALTYLTAGVALLPENAWESRPDLAFALELNRAECEFLTGALAESEARLAELAIRAVSVPDLAAVTRLRLELLTTLGRFDGAVEVGVEYLRRVGVAWSAQPTQEEVRQEYARMWRQLGERPIEALLDLPRMADAVACDTMDVLTALVAPAWHLDLNLRYLIIGRAVNFSLEHGNSNASCHAYALIGAVLGPEFGNYEAGLRFGRLGLDLVEQRGLDRFKARVSMVLATRIIPWTQPIRTARRLMRGAFDAANRFGDLNYAVYSCANLIANILASGDPLAEVQSEAEAALDFVRRAQSGFFVDLITPQLQLVRNLRGLTPVFGCFNDAGFDEERFERHLEEDSRLVTAACWYWVRKLQAYVVANDHTAVVVAATNAERLLWTSPALFERAEGHFYAALARAALCDAAVTAERTRHLEVLAAHHRQLQEWVESCPENFENCAALVGAEIARLDGRELDATRLYELAIHSARANGFIHNEALAYELAARFYAERGFETNSQAHLRNARDCYLRWGALGKVRQLEQVHPELLEDASPRPPAATVGTFVDQFDIGAVVKASQAVSGEIVLDRLIETLMTIALEHAGAERGLLILLRGDPPRIEAEAKTDDKTIDVTLRQEKVTPDALPETVLHTVLRTQQNVILDDASASNPFATDPYIRQTGTRSLLCLPLIRQARLIGVLYLENNLASHVFTPARISVLELLASQAAISLENAGLYADLRASEERWRNLFENVPVGVTLTGPDGRYIAANQTFLEMTGYSEAELRHLSPVDLTHEDDRPDAVAILAARAAGKPYRQHVEKRYRCKDGSVIWVDGSAFVAPVVAGPPVFAAAVIDITDRKRAEQNLQRSEASLARAQQISHTGSWRWNVGTGAVSSSEEFFHIFGFDPATTSLSHTRVMGRIHPDDRPAFEQVVDQAARDRSRFQHEYRVALPDGSVKYLQSVGQPDSTDSGDLEFVGSVIDVTERKGAEEALRNAQAELARVARLTTMGELVASITHEINQPLAAVMTSGNAGLRWLNRDTPDLDRARDALSRIVQDTRRAGDVMRSVRALVKKSGPQLTELDIRDTIKEVLALTRGELQRHGIVLRTDLAGGDRPVLGDRVQLQQVLLNLIMNSIQALGAVSDGRRELTVSAAFAEPDRVLVAVEDTGPGLDPAIAQRIFEPFFTTRSDGLGMGLSICRSIVEAHGGQLWVSPHAPHGTALHFTIPLAVET